MTRRLDFQPEDYEQDIFMDTTTESDIIPKNFYLMYYEKNPESNINTRPGGVLQYSKYFYENNIINYTFNSI